MSDAGLRRTMIGTVLHLVLDVPDRRNALSHAMLRGLTAALNEVDVSVTGVVLSGSGEAFSAGADFRELTGTADDVAYDDDVAAATAAVVAAPRVVIAALEGPCIGAGADLALSCDLRVAGQGSYLQVPAVRLGLLYNPQAVERLRRRLPHDTVRRLLLVGERFPDEEARRAGLVSQVVPRGGAVTRALELLAGIEPEELAALAATKRLLNALDGPAYDPASWAEQRRLLLGSPARAAAMHRAKRAHTDGNDRGRR